MAIGNGQNVTRGYGLLETFLAKKRARKVNALIPANLRGGKILDIGCGHYPYFLNSIEFSEKYGVDQCVGDSVKHNLTIKKFLFSADAKLPFSENYFSVITMLAVIEHLDPVTSRNLLREAYRALARGGILFITTPWGKADWLLKVLAKIKFISTEEFAEHQQFFNRGMLFEQLANSGFKKSNITVKSWQLGLNLIAVAKK